MHYELCTGIMHFIHSNDLEESINLPQTLKTMVTFKKNKQLKLFPPKLIFCPTVVGIYNA